MYVCMVFFFQAEDGIRDLVRSRGLGDVYKRQELGQDIDLRWPGYLFLLDNEADLATFRRNVAMQNLSLIHI